MPTPNYYQPFPTGYFCSCGYWCCPAWLHPQEGSIQRYHPRCGACHKILEPGEYLTAAELWARVIARGPVDPVTFRPLGIAWPE